MFPGRRSKKKQASSLSYFPIWRNFLLVWREKGLFSGLEVVGYLPSQFLEPLAGAAVGLLVLSWLVVGGNVGDVYPAGPTHRLTFQPYHRIGALRIVAGRGCRGVPSATGRPVPSNQPAPAPRSTSPERRGCSLWRCAHQPALSKVRVLAVTATFGCCRSRWQLPPPASRSVDFFWR